MSDHTNQSQVVVTDCNFKLKTDYLKHICSMTRIWIHWVPVVVNSTSRDIIFRFGSPSTGLNQPNRDTGKPLSMSWWVPAHTAVCAWELKSHNFRAPPYTALLVIDFECWHFVPAQTSQKPVCPILRFHLSVPSLCYYIHDYCWCHASGVSDPTMELWK